MFYDSFLYMEFFFFFFRLVILNFICYFENCFKCINYLSVFIDGGE